MFDFNNPGRNVTKLKWSGDLAEGDFAPHGFHVWTDTKTGEADKWTLIMRPNVCLLSFKMILFLETVLSPLT